LTWRSANFLAFNSKPSSKPAGNLAAVCFDPVALTHMERSLERLRSDAVAIFNAAVRAVDAANAVTRSVHVTGAVLEVANRSYSLADFQNIYVLGAGKAAVPMAQAVETLLGERVSGGIVVTKYGQGRRLRKIRVIEAAHPIPDLAGEEAAQRIAAIANKRRHRISYFFLFPGAVPH